MTQLKDFVMSYPEQRTGLFWVWTGKDYDDWTWFDALEALQNWAQKVEF